MEEVKERRITEGGGELCMASCYKENTYIKQRQKQREGYLSEEEKDVITWVETC